jgi:F0F1-type ATP synthase membrane subunit b/b'
VTIIPDITALIVSVIVVCLTLVLKRQFFEPLARAMEAREQQVGGARQTREAAEADAMAAETRVANAVAAVRDEGYREMDRIRREAGERAEATLTTARAQAAATLEAGKDSLREQSARAASELEQVAESLASDLTARVLRRAS